MAQKRTLYITQEVYPYLEETTISYISRYLPQAIHDRGKEIRTFMPKYGNINERRNQLHEVIRLSGMNLIIDETDYSLMIKVASIPAARMQVYFIDNEDFFHERNKFADNDGVEYDDNDARSIFFIRGVLETVKKLRCVPDIIHCHGWFSALAPLYIKKGYGDDPCFTNSKVIYSVYDENFTKPLNENFAERLRFEGIDDEEIAKIKARGTMDYINLTKLAIDHSDGIIQGSAQIDEEIKDYIIDSKKEFLPHIPDFQESIPEIEAFYNRIDS
jgi:starch synthase